MAAAVNILESMGDPALRKDMTEDANLLLVGGGKLLLALSAPMTFTPAYFKADPEAAAEWKQFIEELGKINISEGDLENLLNGSFSIALGSDATILGKSVPGGYAAFTGRKGAAAKILGSLAGSEEFTKEVPLIPLKIDGWDSVYAVDPEEYPASLLLGVMGDTLFVGFVDADALSRAPELPGEITKVLDDPLLGVGFIDAAMIWD